VLPDGRYTATLLASGVSDAAGNPLDGNGDGIAGDNVVGSFLFLLGDANHDGAVNFIDLVALAQNYGGTAKTWIHNPPSLTVEDNLNIGAYTRRDPDGVKADMEMIYDYFPRLVERRRQLAGYLSGGERQMLALATALLCQPAMLLVDELSLGLAPIVVEHLMRLVARLRDELGLAVPASEGVMVGKQPLHL